MNLEKYFPKLMMDENEPFDIKAVATEVYTHTQKSKSFNRTLLIGGKTSKIVEYAVYFDYDIGHLYDLEHIWLYLDDKDRIVYSECSFHGRYIKGIMPDESNKVDESLILYCQPGKHAFAPTPLVFRLLPNYYDTCRHPEARGFLITSVLDGHMTIDESFNQAVIDYMDQFAFTPADKYLTYTKDFDWIEGSDLVSYIVKSLNKELERIHDFKRL
ncbi:hypothetical protein EZV73_00210 [Acidaminobacter sp. JC074]|uniref:hypothetical protein n=1 Tax=Acidaminobacter sp. JC074 TaxID=2530199 RepID=UPI001F0E5A95|nr:hypothetical protein [Acidaminobacter sp. JC074]MCH4885961.1 hypothetical protein [Acidaminobacter sp. JC074]